MFNRILVALDGSDKAEHALMIACDVAKKYDASLILLNAPQIETTAIAVGSAVIEMQPSVEDILAAGHKVIDTAKDKAANLGVTVADTIISAGDPAGEILSAAKDAKADLIVIGRRGLGAITSLLLGSVSQKVMQNADCTCLVVNEK